MEPEWNDTGNGYFHTLVVKYLVFMLDNIDKAIYNIDNKYLVFLVLKQKEKYGYLIRRRNDKKLEKNRLVYCQAGSGPADNISSKGAKPDRYSGPLKYGYDKLVFDGIMSAADSESLSNVTV